MNHYDAAKYADELLNDLAPLPVGLPEPPAFAYYDAIRYRVPGAGERYTAYDAALMHAEVATAEGIRLRIRRKAVMRHIVRVDGKPRDLLLRDLTGGIEVKLDYHARIDPGKDSFAAYDHEAITKSFPSFDAGHLRVNIIRLLLHMAGDILPLVARRAELYALVEATGRAADAAGGTPRAHWNRFLVELDKELHERAYAKMTDADCEHGLAAIRQWVADHDLTIPA